MQCEDPRFHQKIKENKLSMVATDSPVPIQKDVIPKCCEWVTELACRRPEKALMQITPSSVPTV